MVGLTLVEMRGRIDDLATDDGEYYVVCGRTGDRPVPVADERFPDRPTARAAADAAERYRAALRRYDPRVPRYDLIVCQASDRPVRDPGHACPDPSLAPARWTLSDPVLNGSAGGASHGRDRLVERCHRVAAATFESLSDCGHRDVERAVMDRYVEAAEALPTPDGLCLCLLESMAETLSARLDGAEQTPVLARAAARLDAPTSDGDPIAATFTRLRDCGVVGEFSPVCAGTARPARAVATVRFSGYALSPRRGRLPVLPIVVDVFRRRPDRPPRRVWIEPDGEGWRLGVAFVADADPGELVNAPIRPPA